MIQCSGCEYFVRGAKGELGFRCDPFSTIKEPECLVKWQLLKLDMMVRAYQATLEMYKRLAPMQETIFRHMQREVEDLDEGESWKYDQEDEESEGPGEPEEDEPATG